MYGEDEAELLAERLWSMVGRYGVGLDPKSPEQLWDETDAVLITYGDSLLEEERAPLSTLRDFSRTHFKGALSTIHILPFYPWSSDDGFSVIDYRKVDPAVGTWDDVEALGDGFKLMFDLVLNHCSSKSPWFKDFEQGIDPARRYFITENPDTDLSAVVRPRTSPLLTKTKTRDGVRHVWTTFSADQVDLNWANPDVLFEFLDILFYYIAKGAQSIRLDAVAFLWKKVGTDCIHLPETHEMVRLLRDTVELVAPHVVLITETNVPQPENLSYFGDGDEAHMVYNFSLPPLLLHALLTNDATFLHKWASELPDPGSGRTYFNFTASHDGVGVRPLTGLLPDGTLEWVVERVKERGGRVSYRTQSDGSQTPYELNITYVDALRDLDQPERSVPRFLLSQTIAMSLRGMPALYIHSLLGTENYQQGVEESGHNRSINRRKWEIGALNEQLRDPESRQSTIFNALLKLLRRRRNHPAFHPDGAMEVHDFGKPLFGFTRTAPDGSQKILCLFNMTGDKQPIPKLPGVDRGASSLRELITGRSLNPQRNGGKTLDAYQALWLEIG